MASLQGPAFIVQKKGEADSEWVTMPGGQFAVDEVITEPDAQLAAEDFFTAALAAHVPGNAIQYRRIKATELAHEVLS